ncbi:MAG TPA: hypothetical protein DIT89_17510, partial [Planctomycetaceae bacterium]|nr:hypothetical protein [Planctomycetaceae bacterium]
MELNSYSQSDSRLPDDGGSEYGVAAVLDRAEVSESASRLVDISWRDVDATARIVIADNSHSAAVMCRGLLLAGYQSVRLIHNVHDLLKEMRGGRVDLVLLDPDSAGFAGSAVLQAAGVDPEIRSIPIIIVSQDQGPEARREALDFGASDFLKKPLDSTELLPRVRNLLVVRR